MATVNMYTCTAGYKNEKPNDDDDDVGGGGGFFFLSTLSAIDMHSVSWAINNIFIFILDNDDIFIYVSFSLLIFEYTPYNNIRIHFYFFIFSFRLLLFFIIFVFIYRWKPTVIRNFRLVGRSVVHWLKQYHAEFILWWIELMMMMLYVIKNIPKFISFTWIQMLK